MWFIIHGISDIEQGNTTIDRSWNWKRSWSSFVNLTSSLKYIFSRACYLCKFPLNIFNVFLKFDMGEMNIYCTVTLGGEIYKAWWHSIGHMIQGSIKFTLTQLKVTIQNLFNNNWTHPYLTLQHNNHRRTQSLSHDPTLTLSHDINSYYIEG